MTTQKKQTPALIEARNLSSIGRRIMHPMRTSYADGRRTAAFRNLGQILIAVCVATVAVAGCRRIAGTANDISVQENISPQPIRVGQATIAIQLADASARPVAHAKISVEGDMTHPGMSPTFATATEIAPGVYSAQLNINMRGDWVILSHIQLPDGRKMERQMDVRGVESN
jgi:hypothetical protein